MANNLLKHIINQSIIYFLEISNKQQKDIQQRKAADPHI